MSKRIVLRWTIAAMLIFVPMQASAQRDLGERLGKELEDKLHQLGDELKQGWAKVETLVDQLGVRGRIYARVHWDKTLAMQSISIDVKEDGTVVLAGQVKNESDRQKAVQLAQDTLGVNQVIDRLQVEQVAGAVN